MRIPMARGSLFVAVLASFTAGCRNQGARSDPFLQRRIIAPPPAASYAPPSVQVPGATGIPPLQPVPGPLGGTGQWSPAANAASGGAIRPASATVDVRGGGSSSATGSGTARASGDGWVPADTPESAPPDHSASALSDSSQSDQVASMPATHASDSLDWATPRVR